MKSIVRKPSIIKSSSKLLLVFTVIVFAVVLPIQILNNNASAVCYTTAECQAQIDALNQNIAKYHAEAARLNSEAQTLQNALSKLASEKAIIQAQIDISQSKYDELVIKIADTEKKIKDNQDELGVTIANMYVDDKITPLEMLFSSKNIGEYLDKQEYRNSVKNELLATIEKIKDLKISLDQQKTEIEKILGDQKNAKQALVDKENEQQSILNQTQGQEAAYQQLSAADEASRQQAVESYKNLTRPPGGGTSIGISDPSKGNYPWGGNGCYVGTNLWSYDGMNGDGTDALGYACRQCTSYSAWKILEYTGRAYYYWGNAKNWPYSAANNGIEVGTSARANSVGVQTGGFYGHVVWVETDPDGEGHITISQYNSYYDNTGDNSGPGWGNYSKKIVDASNYNRFIYF